MTQLPLSESAVDIQHDTEPADDHGPARRIPHLGHAILFFSLAIVCVFLCLAITLGILTSLTHVPSEVAAHRHPVIGIIAQAAGYVLTLLIAVRLFPRLWQHSFLHGIQWNVLAARRRWPLLIPAGVLLSACAQLALHFIPTPGHAEIEDLFVSPAAAWLTAAFGVLLAPFMEEIAFRGFLLPALATAYDWLALDRTPAGFQRWQNSSLHTTGAVVFAAILSSVPFALLHAAQVSLNWAVVGVLYAVSLVLSLVRIRTHSVACSTLMHATYNFTIFCAIMVSTGGFHHLDRLH
jgi:membrane protease YdiL (CAAX protease family)